MTRSAYTPVRASTATIPNRYTAKPLPWWNRHTITGTTTR